MVEEIEEPKTKVIFRKDKDGSEITAIFPELTENSWNYCACYAHLGQHGTCSHDWYRTKTIPATPDEYADLKAELEELGYVLDVRVTWVPNRKVFN
jgi:hypothetical protein